MSWKIAMYINIYKTIKYYKKYDVGYIVGIKWRLSLSGIVEAVINLNFTIWGGRE